MPQNNEKWITSIKTSIRHPHYDFATGKKLCGDKDVLVYFRRELF